jgi:hypothetical protein
MRRVRAPGLQLEEGATRTSPSRPWTLNGEAMSSSPFLMESAPGQGGQGCGGFNPSWVGNPFRCFPGCASRPRATRFNASGVANRPLETGFWVLATPCEGRVPPPGAIHEPHALHYAGGVAADSPGLARTRLPGVLRVEELAPRRRCEDRRSLLQPSGVVFLFHVNPGCASRPRIR